VLNSQIQKTIVKVFENMELLDNKQVPYKEFKDNELLVSLNLSSQKIIAMINKLVAINIIKKVANGKLTYYSLTPNYKDLVELIKE
jgi:predicted transcriptional regulator